MACLVIPLPPPVGLTDLARYTGRKSGKGCYVYGEGKSKSKTVNEEAEKLLEKYRLTIQGRQVLRL